MAVKEVRSKQLRVPVTNTEYTTIRRQAEAVGLTVAAYLRQVGQNKTPLSAIGHEQMQQLLRVHGDLGRLGGLLKLWLSDDEKLAAFPPGQVQRMIPDALRRILDTQAEMHKAIVQLSPIKLRPAARRPRRRYR